ncbi:alpha/beta fold hydrolase [Mycolicibacterium doricum]|uniref:alpha/beta fold hydrolase n=2 Tax=Mycolicibacterium TaxID=1866885 RepID=UPI001F296BD9|nr:alpha/beta fold hydrolase [Mycolicibacterium doricum]
MGEVIGRGELIIMLHGGGPDHYSMRPLADRLARRYRVALPDIRGYGASQCPDPTLHRWDQYVTDTVAIMHALDATSTHLVGAGLGCTIALRTCLQHPHVARSAVIISAEAIEDDDDKAADAKLMDRFADRARSRGLQAAWSCLFLTCSRSLPTSSPRPFRALTPKAPLPQRQSGMTAPSPPSRNSGASTLRRSSSPAMTHVTPRNSRAPSPTPFRTEYSPRPQCPTCSTTPTTWRALAPRKSNSSSPPPRTRILKAIEGVAQLQPSAAAGFPLIGLDGAALAGDLA